MKSLALASALALATAPMALAAPQSYALDPSHSQVIFSYDHFGFSTTFGMFSGFEGEIMFDEADPAASTVSVAIPVLSMFTGWEQRDGHFLSDDFFGASEGDMVTFASTGIEVTGDDTAQITGDLTMNGVTQSVVLDTVLNGAGAHPINGRPMLGFDATTTVLRSEFELGMFVPAVSDEVEIRISIEALQPEE